MGKKEFDKYTSHNVKDRAPYLTLWVQVDQETLREIDPEDEWDNGDYAENLDEYGVCLGPPPHVRIIDRDVALNEEQLGFMPKIGDKVFLVIESYGQGCTFGSTNPCFKPVRAFKTEAAAEEWTRSEEGENYKDTDYFGGHNEYLIETVTVE